MQQRADSVPEVPAPALTLMERRRRGARAEIAEVALAMFQRDGFEATTVEAIAATAGCSPRTFYRYFGTKEGALFHDLAGAIAGMGEALDRRLAGGEDEWPAVCGSLLEFIARFDESRDGAGVRTATGRMALWSREPALRAHYLQWVAHAEQVMLECLCRHRDTDPRADDRAQVIVVATIGAYRATVTTHGHSGAPGKLTEHLRQSLDLLGTGLAHGGPAHRGPAHGGPAHGGPALGPAGEPR